MSDHIVSEESIIEHATDLNGAPIDDMVSGHKFADKLSAALYVISGHGFDDDSIPSEYAGGFVARINRFIVLEDSQGFVNTRICDTVQHAKWAMDDIRRDIDNPY